MAQNKAVEATKTNPGKTATAGALAVAMALAVPLVAKWEGKRNDPYLDLVKIPTVCYGETNVAMRHHSDAECRDMLVRTLQGKYAAEVIRRTPVLADKRYPTTSERHPIAAPPLPGCSMLATWLAVARPLAASRWLAVAWFRVLSIVGRMRCGCAYPSPASPYLRPFALEAHRPYYPRHLCRHPDPTPVMDAGGAREVPPRVRQFHLLG